MEISFQEWLHKNPILIWRKSKKYSTNKLGRLLRVSRQVINHWEKGRAIPNVHNYYKVQQVTGINYEEWENWINERPDRPNR